MTARRTDRLEMFDALCSTSGDKVTGTLIEELTARDREMVLGFLGFASSSIFLVLQLR